MNTMNFSEVLRDDRQLRSVTGLGRSAFEKLLHEFSICLKEYPRENRTKKPRNRRQRKPGGGRKSALGPPENQLVFILFYLKNYPTYDVLAFMFNVSRGCAFGSIQRLLPLLKHAQEQLKVLPKRTTHPPQELQQLIEEVDHILIDATERAVQRPKKPAQQKNISVEKKVSIRSRTPSLQIRINAS